MVGVDFDSDKAGNNHRTFEQGRGQGHIAKCEKLLIGNLCDQLNLEINVKCIPIV